MVDHTVEKPLLYAAFVKRLAALEIPEDTYSEDTLASQSKLEEALCDESGDRCFDDAMEFWRLIKEARELIGDDK